MSPRTLSPSLVRARLVAIGGSCTRTQFVFWARHMGLSSADAGALVEQLVEGGFLARQGQGPSARLSLPEFAPAPEPARLSVPAPPAPPPSGTRRAHPGRSSPQRAVARALERTTTTTIPQADPVGGWANR